MHSAGNYGEFKSELTHVRIKNVQKFSLVETKQILFHRVKSHFFQKNTFRIKSECVSFEKFPSFHLKLRYNL